MKLLANESDSEVMLAVVILSVYVVAIGLVLMM